jgi:ribonucleotide monophosphatase NagD (HAD superfamily)
MVSPVIKPTVELHQGMKDIADKYDAFLLDQWGVLHDGTIAYDGAVHCLNELLSRGKLIVLLSNSSKRLGNSMKKLDKMGIDR